ncbi:hypothetical protein CDLVIII_0165 [Clostridium sp. DL-VIII]|uniref:hypothetical protein n=1 Tax=Clostridium sp. DL-VIII TaxID=641107 RepID=UPI00023AF80F|nr:hypothetical protein [Clostridium sp. DL-VIII]EHI96903.1 hypothetical protein CDLVIII_0165 [Clostridium sp. DL-VIII]
MNFKDYGREIELIEKQNYSFEQDLYSVIANVMRERKSIKKLSLRDVDNKTKKENMKVFYGTCSFPDFVILSEDFVVNKPCKEKVLGAIEVKYVGKNLKNKEDIMQLKGHLFWFEKVLYTNGLVWKYYEYFPNREHLDEIKRLRNKSYNGIEYSKEEQKLFDEYDLKHQWSISLISGKAADGKYNWNGREWRRLLKKLSGLVW